MRITRPSLLSAVVLFGGIWFCFVNPAYSSPVAFSIQLPAQSIDLSDLDVRDHNNRRIASVAKKNQLRALFEKSLMVIILENLTPAKRHMSFLLNQSWNGAFGWLSQATYKATAVLAAWIAKTKWTHAKMIVQVRSTHASAVRWRHASAQTNFHSLIPSILSSTTLLR